MFDPYIYLQFPYEINNSIIYTYVIELRISY